MLKNMQEIKGLVLCISVPGVPRTSFLGSIFPRLIDLRRSGVTSLGLLFHLYKIYEVDLQLKTSTYFLYVSEQHIALF